MCSLATAISARDKDDTTNPYQGQRRQDFRELDRHGGRGYGKTPESYQGLPSGMP
jgi:hypothetical protein